MEHKEKFKSQTLLSLIPATHGYHIEKVYEGISYNHILGATNFDMIKQTHKSIKDGRSERYAVNVF